MSSLYLHIPFCRSKCPYCDFFSVASDPSALAGYVDLLLRQFALERAGGEWRQPFATVFFGGGTPSLLPPEAVTRLIAAVRELFGLADDAEISLEANPGTVSPASLAGYRAAGVNRLSFGVQSLCAENLRRLGRIHSPQEAAEAMRWARAAGFDNVGIDLMFALPGQDRAALADELDRALELAPDHLSCYGLSIEEETPFYHLHRSGGLDLPDEERYAELFMAVHARLTGAGYRHYEISNYARPGRECRHNLAYWRRLPCLGVGAGAHSLVASDWGERRAVPPDLAAYAASLAAGESPARSLERFDRRGAMAETLYLGLRTAEGVDEARFRRNFGVGVAEAFPGGVAKAGSRLRLQGGRWALGIEGWLIFDHLILPFL